MMMMTIMIKLLQRQLLLVVFIMMMMMSAVTVDGLSSLHQTRSHPPPPRSPSSPSLNDIGTTSRRGFMNHVIAGAATTTAFGVTAVMIFHPQPTLAYPRRDVGAEGERSGITEAFNEQAYKTNNRLEASGFPLDTVEQEQQRLDSAISSFSYDDITTSTTGSKTKKQSKGKATSSKTDKTK